MLVNPRFSFDPVMTQINNILGGGKKTEKIKDGMFLCPHFNFGNTIGNEKEEWFDFPRDGDGEWLNAFGVADTIEQVEEKYEKFLSDPELKFCVSFTPVKKAEQPSEGGWRWHKWGPYIGTKEPQCEYIHDEGDDIEQVYCFHIYQILD